MDDPPGPPPLHPNQAHAAGRSRRAPANKSVSLMHTPSRQPIHAHARRLKNAAASPASIQANPPSTFSSKPNYQKDSSGESSNAEKWFEASNNNVPNVTSNLDNEPPFFLRTSSSSSNEQSRGVNDGRAHASRLPPTHLLPFRAGGLLEVSTGASSSEGYRSVIDDLTVQNKKLKRKLRKFEKLHDAHLEDDKLFEIRVHALPAGKKRELEEMLRKFSMTLEDGVQPSGVDRAEKSTGTGTNQSSDRFPVPLDAKKTNSSQTSKFGDSAYASMSVSGQHSMAPSGLWGLQHKQLKNPIYQPQNQNQNIHSYLKEIPAGLMPKHNVAMTEKAKRKIVVRRLEQIFAGKEPASSGHQQPMQQEEVAQSAARADRKAIEDSGRCAREEGAREARIMPKSKIDPADHVIETPVKLETARGRYKVHGPDSIPSDLEQRPTRPLDLDPYRAQVPAENIEYIRHLGFSPMDAGSAAPAPDGHGWIYLNVLINMAQLHTISVTADFVRRSIANFSEKLELSSDGRKVRWKGGTDVTKTSSDGSPEDENRGSSSQMKAPKSKGSSNLAMVSNDGSSENISSSRKTTSSNTNSRDKLAYTPLFFHKAESEDDDNLSDENGASWSSPRAGFVAGNWSGFTSSGKRTNSSRKRKGDDGPIIFYSKAQFCTDLSGDPRPRNVVFANSSKYDRLRVDPIGMQDEKISAKDQLDLQGPLSKPRSPPDDDSVEMDTSSPGDEMDVDCHPMKGRFSEGSSSEESPHIMDFEASGIGGVLLEDNFAIRVKSRRKLIDDQDPSSILPRAHRIKAIPPHMQRLLVTHASTNSAIGSASARNSSVVEEQILSMRSKALPPSELPPASFFPFSSLDGDEFDSDSDSETSDKESSESTDENAGLARDRPLPTSAPQLMTFAAYDSGLESSSEDSGVVNNNNNDDDEDNDYDDEYDMVQCSSSADLLTHALSCSRSYDAETAAQLADEIPTGSSAATAGGGGSGYSTPARGGSGSGGSGDVDFALARRGGHGLKRNRGSESVARRRGEKSYRMEED